MQKNAGSDAIALPFVAQEQHDHAGASRDGDPAAQPNGLAPPLEGKRIQVFLAMVVIDVAILLGTFALVSFAYLINVRGQFNADSSMLSAYLLLPIFLTIGLFNGAYSGGALERLARCQLSGDTSAGNCCCSAELRGLFCQDER